jgi:hypothetical protein
MGAHQVGPYVIDCRRDYIANLIVLVLCSMMFVLKARQICTYTLSYLEIRFHCTSIIFNVPTILNIYSF